MSRLPLHDSPASEQQVEADLERFSVYGYHLWEVVEAVQLTAGASYDYVRYPVNTDLSPLSGDEKSAERVSPKLGLIWRPFRDTTIRAAHTRSIGGLFYDGSVRLEPTQVAGFTQVFRSMIPESVGGVIAGAEFTTYGLGFDQRLGSNTYFVLEAELLESEAERTVGVFDFTSPPPATPSGTPERLDFQEQSLTVALTQLLGENWATGGRYRTSRAELDRRFPENPPEFGGWGSELESILHEGELFLLWQDGSGFFARGEALWRQQSNRGYEPDRPGDDFWHYNAYAGYRFPRRHAEVRIGVLNIADRDYRLNPLNLYSDLPRDRTLSVSLRTSF